MKAFAPLNTATGGAGGGRGGAFPIQTNLRRPDQGAISGSNSSPADPSSGDSSEFQKALQQASRSPASPNPSDQPAQPKSPQPNNAQAKQSNGQPDGASDASQNKDAAFSSTADGSQQASGKSSEKDAGSDDPSKNDKPAADDSQKNQPDASSLQAAKDASASGLVTQATQASPNAQTPAAPTEPSSGSDGQAAQAPVAPKVTLQSVIQQAVTSHQPATLPDKSQKPDPSDPQDVRSLQMKAEAKQQFLAVAEERAIKGSQTAATQAAPQAAPEKAAPSDPHPLAQPTQNAQAAAVFAKQAASGQQQNQNVSPATAQAPDALSESTATAAPSAPAGDAPSRLIAAVEKDPVAEKAGGTPSPLTLAVNVPQPSAKGAEAAPAAHESPAMSPQETYDQIVLGLKGQMDPKSGKAQIMLDPPNLGAVKVSLSLANGVLTAQFESSTSAVRDLLKSNLDKLKTVLQGQGIAVDKLAVDAPAAAKDAGTAGGQMQQNASGSGTHDGRSAGGFGQDSRSGQERWQQPNGANGFAQMFAQTQEAPIDLVA